MANIRQSILIRTDLNLPVGLLAAQVAHLHMETIRSFLSNKLLKLTKDSAIDFSEMGEHGAILEEWLESPYIFVHGVCSYEVLDLYFNEFKKWQIPVYEWRDTITIDISPTQKKVFKDLLVGIVAGPSDSDRIKSVISDLPLL